LIDAMPFSALLLEAKRSLLRMVSWLPAFNTNLN
jgi:hypothetical protein